MFKVTKAFSSFSVDDVQKAKFYGQILGLEVSEAYGGQLLKPFSEAYGVTWQLI
jgi:hypothetical protein